VRGKLTINNHYIGDCEYAHDEGDFLLHISSQTGQEDLNEMASESVTISGLDLSQYEGQKVDLQIDGDELLNKRGVIQKHKDTYQLVI